MPRVIFKCPYIKPGVRKAAAHLNNYVRYIAAREGAEKLTQSKSGLPATKKQKEMVDRLLRDFPLSRGMFEYEDYAAAPTRGSASEFISRALEDNYDQIAKRENYVSYIAQRPRAEHISSHALFNGSDEPISLSRISSEVANHPGNVWLPIISLRREDAARLGYDSAKQWQSFLTSYAMEMAEAMKIPWDQFRCLLFFLNFSRKTDRTRNNALWNSFREWGNSDFSPARPVRKEGLRRFRRKPSFRTFACSAHRLCPHRSSSLLSSKKTLTVPAVNDKTIGSTDFE